MGDRHKSRSRRLKRSIDICGPEARIANGHPRNRVVASFRLVLGAAEEYRQRLVRAPLLQ